MSSGAPMRRASTRRGRAGAGSLRQLTTARLRSWDTTSPRRETAGQHSSRSARVRSEEHTSELQSRGHLVCRLLLEKKKNNIMKKLNRLHYSRKKRIVLAIAKTMRSISTV